MNDNLNENINNNPDNSTNTEPEFDFEKEKAVYAFKAEPTATSYYIDEPAKPKRNGLKTFGKIVAVCLAVALISFSSIEAYKYFSDVPPAIDDPAPSGPADKPDAPIVPDIPDKPDEPSKPVVNAPTFETTEPSNDALATVDIAEKVRPSIVTVICATQTGSSSGSGVIMSDDGYIVTNYHVIDGAVSVEVYLSDDTKYTATVIGGDSLSDIAVLKVDGEALPKAEFGDSSLLRVGETALAIGNPLGIEFAGTVTRGIISGLDREVEVGGVSMTLIQTDASINSGNSGGALVNSYGQIVGITSSKIDITYAEGLGFAIPSNDVVKVVNDLIAHGYVQGRPFIGLSGADVNYYMQMYYRLPQGVYIEEVTKDSPADKAGLKRGDIITAADGVAITSITGLNNIKNKKSIGDTITLTVYSYNSTKEVVVTLAEYKGE